jgi:hypothetical protein
MGASMGEGVTFMTRRTNDSIEYIIAYRAKTKILHHLKQRKTCKLLQNFFFLILELFIIINDCI